MLSFTALQELWASLFLHGCSPLVDEAWLAAGCSWWLQSTLRPCGGSWSRSGPLVPWPIVRYYIGNIKRDAESYSTAQLTRMVDPYLTLDALVTVFCPYTEPWDQPLAKLL